MPDHPIDRWIDERLVPAAEGERHTPAADLHRDLDGWCRDLGMAPAAIPCAHTLYSQLAERGFTRSRRTVGRHYGAVRLFCFNVALRPRREDA